MKCKKMEDGKYRFSNDDGVSGKISKIGGCWFVFVDGKSRSFGPFDLMINAKSMASGIKSPMTSAEKARKAADIQRELDRSQRKRWANNLDWPAIDEFIKKVNEARDKLLMTNK